MDGIAATLGVLERAGLGHAGMARTVDEAAVPTLYDVEGVTVGHLSYTYGLNELRLPPDQQWAVDVIDPDAIEAEARAAVDAGDKYVIYGLGNFLTNQSPLSCRSCPESTTDGVIVGVDLAEASDGRIEVVGVNAIPTWVDRRSFTITDIAAVLAGDLGPNTTRHFERSWKRTAPA